MMNGTNILIWSVSIALDVIFLYIWMAVFARKRKLHPALKCMLLLLSIAALSYVNCMKGRIFSITFGFVCFVIISMLLFEDRFKRLLFYNISYFAVGTAAEILFSAVLGYMGEASGNYPIYGAGHEDSALLLLFAEKSLKLIAYCVIMALAAKRAFIYKSDEDCVRIEKQHGLKYYIPFYAVSVIVHGFMAGIYVICKTDVVKSGIFTDGFVIMSAIAAVIINLIAVYIFGEFSIMAANTEKMNLMDTRLNLEEKYYRDLEKLHEQYDIFLHDTRHMMRTISTLSREGNCGEIEHIMETMRFSLCALDENIICSNKILNALLSERKSYADNKGVVLDLEIAEPLYLKEINELDLITLVGNVLDNAIEAEIQSAKGEGVICNMHMSNNGRHVIIQVENSYEEKRADRIKAIKMIEKIGNKHGIGLKSVGEVVKKYGGIFESGQEDGMYKVKLILPVQSGWEAKATYTDSVPAYAQSAYK